MLSFSQGLVGSWGSGIWTEDVGELRKRRIDCSACDSGIRVSAVISKRALPVLDYGVWTLDVFGGSLDGEFGHSGVYYTV